MTPKVFIPLLGVTTLVSASAGFAFVKSKLSYEQHGARDHLALQGEGRDRDEGWTNGKDRTSGKGGAAFTACPDLSLALASRSWQSAWALIG